MAISDSGRAVSPPIPWISGLLVVACAVVSIQARVQNGETVRAGMEALDASREYFLVHPYLEPGPLLATRVDAAQVERARRDFAKGRVVETPAGVMRRQQAELDEQIAAAIANVRALPARGIAVVPADGPAPTWLWHALLHTSTWHLVGNMVLLLLFGVYLEGSLGRFGYAGLVASVTLAGAAAWTVMASGEAKHGLIGTTPLLSGLLVAFAARLSSHHGDGFYRIGCAAGALWLVLPPLASAPWSFTGIELITTTRPPAPSQVYWACLAAAGAGALASALAWLAGIDGEPAAGESPAARDPRFRRAMRARRAGRPREALEALSEYLGAEPDAYEAALALWEVAAELGRDAERTAALLRVIRIELKRERADAAIDHWLELVRDGIPEKVDPSLLIHMALLLRAQDHRVEAVRALSCALERSDERENHVIAARIARAARGLDPGVTEMAAWRALGSVELSLSERQALENLIAEVLESAGGRPTFTYTPPHRSDLRSPAARCAPASPAGTATERARSAAASRAVEAPVEPSGGRPEAIEIETHSRALDTVLAVPLELSGDGLEIQTAQGQKKLVRYERIEAVAVAAVSGIGTKPVILVDLVLNWMTPKNETLRVVRLRGDQFDPRRVMSGHASPVDALRALVQTVLERSGAAPLPDAESAHGRPFASFDALAIYHRAVLMVEGAEPSSPTG